MTWKTWPKTDQTSTLKRSIYNLLTIATEWQKNWVSIEFGICLKSVPGRPVELKMSLGYTKIHSRWSSFFSCQKKIRLIVPVIISWSNPFLNSFSSKAISVWFFFWSSSMVYFSIRVQVFRFLCISKIVFFPGFEYGAQQNISKLSLL